MAKRKPDEPKKGAPEWQCTFSDLMNLLLCFFVLLFSMSSVEEEKWEQVVSSMNNAFSIFSSGSAAIGNGSLIGIGTSQLSNLDEYYNSLGQTSEELGDDQRDAGDAKQTPDKDKAEGSQHEDNKGSGEHKEDSKIPGEGDDKSGQQTGQTDKDKDKDGEADKDKNGEDSKLTDEELIDMVAAAGRAETEAMVDRISELTERYNISDSITVTMDSAGKYAEMIISGSLLFDSGSATLKDSCLPLLSKVGDILKVYSNHSVDIIGHTDNVPMKSAKFDSNDILSSARAISAAQYLVKEKKVDVTRLSWTGRGEYEPIASNSTAEGRAKNRRVEIRIYNSYNSK